MKPRLAPENHTHDAGAGGFVCRQLWSPEGWFYQTGGFVLSTENTSGYGFTGAVASNSAHESLSRAHYDAPSNSIVTLSATHSSSATSACLNLSDVDELYATVVFSSEFTDFWEPDGGRFKCLLTQDDIWGTASGSRTYAWLGALTGWGVFIDYTASGYEYRWQDGTASDAGGTGIYVNTSAPPYAVMQRLQFHWVDGGWGATLRDFETGTESTKTFSNQPTDLLGLALVNRNETGDPVAGHMRLVRVEYVWPW